MARQAGQQRVADGGVRSDALRSDERELLARPYSLSEDASSERANQAASASLECRENNDRTGGRDHRIRYGFPAASAASFSAQSDRQGLVSRSGAARDDGVSKQLAPRRLFHHRRARRGSRMRTD